MIAWRELSDSDKLQTWATHLDNEDEGSPGPALRRMLAEYDDHVARIAELERELRDCSNTLERECFLGRHPAVKRARKLLAKGAP